MEIWFFLIQKTKYDHYEIMCVSVCLCGKLAASLNQCSVVLPEFLAVRSTELAFQTHPAFICLSILLWAWKEVQPPCSYHDVSHPPCIRFSSHRLIWIDYVYIFWGLFHLLMPAKADSESGCARGQLLWYSLQRWKQSVVQAIEGEWAKGILEKLEGGTLPLGHVCCNISTCFYLQGRMLTVMSLWSVWNNKPLMKMCIELSVSDAVPNRQALIELGQALLSPTHSSQHPGLRPRDWHKMQVLSGRLTPRKSAWSRNIWPLSCYFACSVTFLHVSQWWRSSLKTSICFVLFRVTGFGCVTEL